MGVMQMGGVGMSGIKSGSTALPGRVCDRGGCVLMGVKVFAVWRSPALGGRHVVVWVSRGWCVWVRGGWREAGI